MGENVKKLIVTMVRQVSEDDIWGRTRGKFMLCGGRDIWVI